MQNDSRVKSSGVSIVRTVSDEVLYQKSSTFNEGPEKASPPQPGIPNMLPFTTIPTDTKTLIQEDDFVPLAPYSKYARLLSPSQLSSLSSLLSSLLFYIYMYKTLYIIQ
jgi:hypothetical protein